MRAALISLNGQPQDLASDRALRIAGRPLAQRQLEFALAAGCTRIVALGDGASPQAIALRHVAERAGARFQTIRQSHDLLGVVRANDDLLVLAPRLLPQAREALAELARGSGMLVLDAGAGVAAGFERIDLDRAWAGVLAIPGALVERLAQLPPDSDPAAALLRIACQARVPERRLPAVVLAEGGWAMLGAGLPLPAVEEAWVERNLPPKRPFSPSERLARAALRRVAPRLLANARSKSLVQGAALLLLGAAVALSAWGLAAAGFGVLALGTVVATFSAGLARLAAGPFGAAARRRSWALWQSVAVDLALTAVCIFAVEGDWLHRLFPALVLTGALKASRIRSWPGAPALLGDRALLALLLTAAAAVGVAEAGIMLGALAILALHAAKSEPHSG